MQRFVISKRLGGTLLMMGQQMRNESPFYYFRWEEQIPEDHLLRLIDRHVDLSFVRDRLVRFLAQRPPKLQAQAG